MMRLLLALLFAFVTLPAAAQRAPDSFPGCVYNATPPTLADKQVIPWQCDINGNLLISGGGGGSGTVTDVSVVSANGFAGSVATSTTTPAITLSTTVTGLLSGNGTAISAASTTGSGAVVLATSPTLVTPALGTPTAINLANATNLPVGAITGVLPVANGGTNASSASITAFNNITGYTAAGATGTTSTNLVFSTSPTLVTPTLGAATATSINGLTITSSTGTLTIANSKTLTVSNSLTLAGTDGSTLNVGAGGTLGTAAYVNTGTSGATIPLLSTANTWSLGQTISAGVLQLPDGASAAAPSLRFTSGNIGIYGVASNIVGIAIGGNLAASQSATLMWQRSDSGEYVMGVAADVRIIRDAANILAQRNSTTAQTFRLYGTWTNASNGDWLESNKTAGGAAYIRTVANGTGTASTLALGVAGTNWQMITTAGLTAFGSSVAATSSFPAIKRSSAILVSRLADDSANAAFEAATVDTDGFTVGGLPAAGVAGRRAYVTDQLTACAATGAALTGGGAVVCPVFDNGSAWVSD